MRQEDNAQKEMTTIKRLHSICDNSSVQGDFMLIEINSFAWMVRTIMELNKTCGSMSTEKQKNF
ncbi:hypothetical protein ACTFRP_29515 [Bacillus cereus group sp. MYBK234-1]|uniref:hypothetical protein n=1 Tax=unclassified Bacillus cereus group TaxID=2750818 RepID=UPI003F79B838